MKRPDMNRRHATIRRRVTTHLRAMILHHGMIRHHAMIHRRHVSSRRAAKHHGLLRTSPIVLHPIGLKTISPQAQEGTHKSQIFM